MSPQVLATVETLGPLVAASANLLSRLIAGITDLAQAKSELRAILDIAGQRLDAWDVVFKERDQKEDERVRELAKSEPTKP